LPRHRPRKRAIQYAAANRRRIVIVPINRPWLLDCPLFAGNDAAYLMEKR
jgi:hypothetical protein